MGQVQALYTVVDFTQFTLPTSFIEMIVQEFVADQASGIVATETEAKVAGVGVLRLEHSGDSDFSCDHVLVISAEGDVIARLLMLEYLLNTTIEMMRDVFVDGNRHQ